MLQRVIGNQYIIYNNYFQIGLKFINNKVSRLYMPKYYTIYYLYNIAYYYTIIIVYYIYI